jgi:hypothetical protein
MVVPVRGLVWRPLTVLKQGAHTKGRALLQRLPNRTVS